MVVNSLVVFSRKVADGVAVYSHNYYNINVYVICSDYLFAVKKGNNNNIIMFIAKISFHLEGFIKYRKTYIL